MQKSSSRGGYSKEAALEAEFLHRQLSNADLIKRLKVVTETLEQYSDDDDDVERAKSETFHLSSSLGEDWLLEHKNKDVRLLVACALADILRLYAPEPPYEEETNADVIKLFIKILRGFQSPDMTPQHPSYSIHFYLLERLSNISIFSIIPELESCRDELLKMLVQAAYDIAGDIAMHHATSKVTDHLTTIICSVIEDMALVANGIQVELLDLMVCALCQDEKRKNQNGYALMRKVISSCPNNFQPFLERQLHQVKTGIQLESDLTNKDRLAEAVFELSTIAPKCLTGVLGAYAEDLQLEDSELRIKAVKLLGAVFSVGNYHVDFSAAFAEFKRRSLDKETDVRKALVSVMQALVTKRAEMGKILMEDEWNFQGGSREAPMLKLVLDLNEEVRKDAVSAVLSACLNNCDAVPQAIVEIVAERVLDKKMPVRKVAMEGLAKLWHKYCAPVTSSRLHRSMSERFGWIPSKILTLASADSWNRNMVIHCLEDICMVPPSDERSTTQVAVDLYGSLDDKGRDSLVKLVKQRGRLCESFRKFCELREQVETDMDLEDGEKKEAEMLQSLSQHFPDPGPALDQLQKLHGVKDQMGRKVWQLLDKLAREPADQAGTLKVQQDVLKRLGPKHPQLAFVKTLVAKLSDKCFGADFVRLVFRAMVQDESDYSAAAKRCLSLIPELAASNKHLVAGEAKSLEALLTSHCDDAAVCESVLKSISAVGEELTDLSKSKAGIQRIKDLCMHESWAVAKYAVRSLVALGCDDRSGLTKVAQEAASQVAFCSKLPSYLRVIMEVAKACPEAVAKDREAVSKFVRRRLLQGAWPSSAGTKQRQIIIDAKVQGLKLLTVLSFHEDDENGTGVLELCQDIIARGGEIQSSESGTSKNDRMLLRMTAGSCILKVSKEAVVQSRVSPIIFSSLSRLFDDEERAVKEAMLKKVFKGTASQQGKLPFRFASLFALVVHDAESAVVELGKRCLRNTLMVMSKFRKKTGSEVVNIMCEHLVPWLTYVLVVHPDFADSDEDPTQRSVALKKYFECFLSCVPSEEQNATAMQQILQYIKKCSVPAAAIGDVAPRVVETNITSAIEVAERMLLNKRWATKGFASGSAVGKIVDASIFCEKGGKGKAVEDSSVLALSHAEPATSFVKSGGKSAGTPRKRSLAADVVSPAKSPAKSPHKRRHGTDDDTRHSGMEEDGSKEEADAGGDAFDFDTEDVPSAKAGAQAGASAQKKKRGQRPESLSSQTKASMASMGEAESQKDKCSHGHVPQKGEVLEFEMSEPTAPGGVEWLAGTVLQVDLKKQTFKVIIKEDEDAKDTWSKETYKFSDEGKEWRLPVGGQTSSAAKPKRLDESSEPKLSKPGKSGPAPKAAKVAPASKQAKASPVSKAATKSASPRSIPMGRPSEAVGASGKKTPATKRKESSPSVTSTPVEPFDDFAFDDEAHGDGAMEARSHAKKPSPQRASGELKGKAKGARSKPAMARESGVVAKARHSAIVDEQSSQALWQQALASVENEVASSRPPAAKSVKRRRI